MTELCRVDDRSGCEICGCCVPHGECSCESLGAMNLLTALNEMTDWAEVGIAEWAKVGKLKGKTYEDALDELDKAQKLLKKSGTDEDSSFSVVELTTEDRGFFRECDACFMPPMQPCKPDCPSRQSP